ncbi:hypothetical protein L596_000268 [Steinernema carpocapsae]|uniref:Uncharacterized protein n=1 Tax=Steinernema carpocapsae TaxID=34508 RepID=A0A4U8UHU7_STECR|nr:hypothetical protein L596_000268 [Steinernema carpocapsae]
MTADKENGKLALNGNGRLNDDNREALLENEDDNVGFEYTRKNRRESFVSFCKRHYQNIVHFIVEDWLLSGLLQQSSQLV